MNDRHVWFSRRTESGLSIRFPSVFESNGILTQYWLVFDSMTPTKKVVLLGAARAGKTSLASRLMFDRFDPDQAPTIGVELYEFKQSMADRDIDVLLWDTDSELGDDVLKQEFAKGADAALVVADATDANSINEALSMRDRFLEQFPRARAVIALNKTEENVIEKSQAVSSLKQLPYAILCSAKTGSGVKQAILQALDL